MDLAALKAEIVSDPKGLGIKALSSTGADYSIAQALNSLTGKGAEPILVGSITKNAFLLRIVIPALIALEGKDAAVQAKWMMIKEVALAADSFYGQDPALTSILEMAVSDGLLTQEQLMAFLYKTGSRAEVLFGEGVQVSADDVAKALRG